MADPVIIPIPADTWTEVATDVQAGQIHILNPTNDNWFYTIRDTGGSAPTSEVPEVKLFFQSTEIKSNISIDVYVFVKGNAGRVRADL